MGQSVIRFSGRRPIPERVTIGMEGEHNAEELVLVNLPEIAEGQTETIELVNWNGSAADALLLTDHKVLLTRTTMSMTGTLTAWAVVQNGTSVVWKSEKFFLEVRDLPDADEMIEQQYPTAFEQAMGVCGAYAADAEAWARGTRGGADVGDDDDTYSNNARYYSGYAEYCATTAGNAAADAEALAKGTRDGAAVTSGDAAYHNNAKYYAAEADNSATAAANSQTAAGLSAGAAADSEENAEAWANGTRNGTDVSSDDPVYHKNGAYYREQALGAMNNAQTYKRQAEAYARGTRDGTPVPRDGVGYHDNAKWYAEQAAAAAAAAVAPLVLEITEEEGTGDYIIEAGDFTAVWGAWTGGKRIFVEAPDGTDNRYVVTALGVFEGEGGSLIYKAEMIRPTAADWEGGAMVFAQEDGEYIGRAQPVE